jgi:hypothetical protein
MPLDSISSSGYVKFSFPAVDGTSLNSYYMSLDLSGSGSVMVGSGPGDAYLYGALYENVEPQDAQLTFRLEYAPLKALFGLIKEVIKWTGFSFIAVIMIILPGWATLSLLLPAWLRLTWGEKAGISIGVGMALYPLLYLWADVVGLRIGRLSAWVFPILGLIITLYRSRRAWRVWSSKSPIIPRKITNWFLEQDRAADFVFLISIGFIAFTRFWPVRTLDTPMWGDSYQHTLIPQLLVENTGLFSSWKPYAELQSFTYHFGFHTLVASFHWLTNLDMPQATLWMGQIANVLAVIALYPLAVFVGGNRWCGVIAVLVAGLLSPMPMVYVNWGRYTQLAGQAILPAAILLIWLNVKSGNQAWKWLSLIWIVLSGLFLTHYRVLLAIFVLYFRQLKISEILRTGIVHALGVILISLPWLIILFEGKLPEQLGMQVATPASQISAAAQQYNIIGNLATYLAPGLWICLLLSIVYGLWRRIKEIILIALWWFIVFLAANPGWIGLPGTGIISNFAVLIAAYIPAGVLVGVVAGKLIPVSNNPPHSIQRKKPGGKTNWSNLGLLFVCLLIGVWGTGLRLHEVSPQQHALVTPPDVRAGKWIRENLSRETIFLVNSFFAYGGSLVVGSDSGWWLPLLSARATTLPPINYNSEKGPRPDYVKYTNDLVYEIEEKGISHPEVLKELEDRLVTHLYIGQRQGKVNVTGSPLLKIEELVGNPVFRPIYHQDRVWIFEIVR